MNDTRKTQDDATDTKKKALDAALKGLIDRLKQSD